MLKSYTIRFVKTVTTLDDRQYEVKDSTILATLSDLKTRYHFSVLSVDLDEPGIPSKIVIKADKHNKDEILFAFSKIPEDYITNIEMR